MVAFACASCQMKLSAKEELAGKQVKCPGCGHTMMVPQAAATPASPVPPGSAPWQIVPPLPAAKAGERTLPPNPVPERLSDANGHPGLGNGRRKEAIQAEPAARPSPELWNFLAPAQQPDEIGRLGPYRILQVLGAGGMGVVFRAEDPSLQRLVALKAMLPSLACSAAAKERFFREARSAAALKHPHIVTIFQVGEDRGAPYLAMEYLEGEPLDGRLKRQPPVPLAEVLRIGREVAEGLSCAHEKGLIHRDIKPANIWLEGHKGLAKILDFGLARALDDQTHLTQSGAIVGTPAYMAPEQAMNQGIDPRCDLFSLGCVLYRLTTGRLPFQGDNTLTILSALAKDTPPEPASLNPALPPELNDLIVQLLAKQPEARPGTAQEVAAALRVLEHDAQATQLMEAPPRRRAQPPRPGPGVRRGAKKSRLPLLLGIAGALVAAVLGVLVLFWQTPHGLVRIESDDPGVEIVFDKTGPTVKGAEKEPIVLGVGEHGLVIKRGDFTFETDKLVVKKGATITVKIELQKGKVQLVQDGQVISSRDIPLPPRFTNSLGMAFALVPRGKSWLGGGAGKVGTKEVEIPQDFYLGVYEVTQEEWEKVMGTNPSTFKAVAGQKRFPVENVSWEEAQAFVKRVNERVKEAGWEYRLPTEEEWEYACRGGPMADKADSAFDYYFAQPTNELKPEQANFNLNVKRTCKVGSYAPNRLGLYDMHGNVREWCADEVKAADGASRRVRRGGDWGSSSVTCRAAGRFAFAPVYRDSYLGLRLSRVPVGK